VSIGRWRVHWLRGHFEKAIVIEFNDFIAICVDGISPNSLNACFIARHHEIPIGY
jgi:hypothetical protein